MKRRFVRVDDETHEILKELKKEKAVSSMGDVVKEELERLEESFESEAEDKIFRL